MDNFGILVPHDIRRDWRTDPDLTNSKLAPLNGLGGTNEEYAIPDVLGCRV